MATLDPDTRNQLAKTIQAARRQAEDGARRALDALAVGNHEPHATMTPEQRDLRVHLRSHGRQLGDERDASRGTQATSRLAHEVAYEHWHRMLFARFLAENQLLLEPDSGVAVSMEECRDLAREQRADPWVLAARFAQGMLPEIFRQDDPSLKIELPRETRVALERLLEDLPPHVFTSDDALGWTYQYWQAEKKDEVNQLGEKIGADALPAVTQLFTEHYMVLFLLHNTVGAWRAGRILSARPDLATGASSEDELRRVVRLVGGPGYDFEYLRFVRNSPDGESSSGGTGEWRPAAGVYDTWPETTRGLRVIDPCCGSGHFLVAALRLLSIARAEEEGIGLEDAVRAVLSENLFGLELDARCTQLAAFAVALEAWRIIGSPVKLPRLNIACSGIAPNSKKEEWVGLVGDDPRLRGGMARLHDFFERAPTLGSLINPRAIGGRLLEANFAELEPRLATVIERERDNVDGNERTVAAQGMARAAELLAGKYSLIVTNVPYLGERKQDATLKEHLATFFAKGKADLATAFIIRSLDLCAPGGTAALVTPHNWLFLGAYTRLRESLLSEYSWNVVARLGSGAFETIGGEVVNVALVAISEPEPLKGGTLAAVDVSDLASPADKSRGLAGTEAAEVRTFLQADQLKNPDARISFSAQERGTLLSKFVDSAQGVKTGDDERWRRRFTELPPLLPGWEYYQTSVDATGLYGGASLMIDWRTTGKGMVRPRLDNIVQGRQGVAISAIGSVYAALYLGGRFESSVAPLVPKKPDHLPAIWAFVASEEYGRALRAIDQSLAVTTDTLSKVPFDLARWEAVANDQYPQGLPAPESNDPASWLFHGRPDDSTAPLHVASIRLLGYHWPAELDQNLRLSSEARDRIARCAEFLPFEDQDGIVCLDSLRGEDAAVDRLRRILVTAYGSEWSAARERELIAATGGKSVSIDEWLRSEFFEQHCKLFQHRPFIWHIWDGRKDGFNALVNYHKLAGPGGRRTLEALTYSYLEDWIKLQRQQQKSGLEGSDARLAAALDLQGQLVKIIDGGTPYDIFVRWKSLHEQPVGWEPDINDGVRMNIRPFMTAELRAGGRKGAGILRWKPNIKWDKDRGAEADRPRHLFPWFWSLPKDASEAEKVDFMGGAEFDGNRWNDLHYTKAAKQAARDRHAAKGGKP